MSDIMVVEGTEEEPEQAAGRMLEEDPNSNSDPRWGPNSSGAKELKSLYSKGIIIITYKIKYTDN